MKYDIDIKAVVGGLTNYYAKSTTLTNDSQPVYVGNIVDRAFWYNDASGEWINTTTALIGDATPAAGTYTAPTLYGDYVDDDLNELTASQYTIGDAWYRAETTAFESLRNFLGCVEERECYRGYLPASGDTNTLKSFNVWMLTSGNSGEFEIDRLAGDNALWCSLRADASIEGVFETRQRAMNFAGAVMAWLKETNNLAETGNVEQCRLLDVPDQPAEEFVPVDGKLIRRVWRQSINLELIYKTENVFD